MDTTQDTDTEWDDDARSRFAYTEFDATDVDPSIYTEDELDALDDEAIEAIRSLADQDFCTDDRAQEHSVDDWHRSAGEAGDLVTCRAIEWANSRVPGGAQAIYDERYSANWRYVARQLRCATCGRLATHGQWADGPDEQLCELPLCDNCPTPEGWEAA